MANNISAGLNCRMAEQLANKVPAEAGELSERVGRGWLRSWCGLSRKVVCPALRRSCRCPAGFERNLGSVGLPVDVLARQPDARPRRPIVARSRRAIH